MSFVWCGPARLRLPFLDCDRPSLVIAPASAQLQVARRKPFQPKPAPLHELARCFVVRLNIRLEPVEPLFRKSVSQHSRESPLHITTPVVGYESIVSKITRAKHAPHNLVDIDYSGQFALFSANPVHDIQRAAQSLEMLFKSKWRTRRVGPVTMELTAASDGRQEFVL